MEHSELSQVGSSLKAKFRCSHAGLSYFSYLSSCCHVLDSQEYVICGLVSIQFRLEFVAVNDDKRVLNVMLKLLNVNKFDDSTVTADFRSEALNADFRFLVNDNDWRLVGAFHENANIAFREYWLDVSFLLNIRYNSPKSFASLHGDTELTNFELRGIDGSVYVHKAVLAGCSPVLKQKLSEQFLEIQDATQETLQQLKDLIYLHELPEAGLGKVVLIASAFMIDGLDLLCFLKLLSNFNAENATEILHLSRKCKMEKLFLAVLMSLQRGDITVEDIDL